MGHVLDLAIRHLDNLIAAEVDDLADMRPKLRSNESLARSYEASQVALQSYTVAVAMLRQWRSDGKP